MLWYRDLLTLSWYQLSAGNASSEGTGIRKNKRVAIMSQVHVHAVMKRGYQTMNKALMSKIWYILVTYIFLFYAKNIIWKCRNYIHLIESDFCIIIIMLILSMGRIAYKSVTMLSLQPSCVKSVTPRAGIHVVHFLPFSSLSLCSPILFILALPQFSQ